MRWVGWQKSEEGVGRAAAGVGHGGGEPARLHPQPQDHRRPPVPPRIADRLVRGEHHVLDLLWRQLAADGEGTDGRPGGGR